MIRLKVESHFRIQGEIGSLFCIRREREEKLFCRNLLVVLSPFHLDLTPGRAGSGSGPKPPVRRFRFTRTEPEPCFGRFRWRFRFQAVPGRFRSGSDGSGSVFFFFLKKKIVKKNIFFHRTAHEPPMNRSNRLKPKPPPEPLKTRFRFGSCKPEPPNRRFRPGTGTGPTRDQV